MVQPNWADLTGGYRVPYDPRAVIAKLRLEPLNPEAWHELWNELHHQGDVGEASYAVVPLLLEVCEGGPRDWNFYGLIATIETERRRSGNPIIPDWLSEDYSSALQQAKALALSDLATAREPLMVQSALAVVAFACRAPKIGALLTHLDGSEAAGLLDDLRS